MSGNKRFDVALSLAELYAIRNALQGTKEDRLLNRVNKIIKTLHDYFDGRIHLPYGFRPFFQDHDGNEYWMS